MAVQDAAILRRAYAIQCSVPSPQAGGAIILPSNILGSAKSVNRTSNVIIEHLGQLSTQLSIVNIADHRIEKNYKRIFE